MSKSHTGCVVIKLNLKQHRRKLDITQKELANLLGVDATSVTKWETGEALPRADKLPQLAQILDCKIDDLFDEEERG